MATYSSKTFNNQIVIIVDVSIPGLEAITPIRVNSLFDTGAQRTAVSPHLIESLGLKNIGIDFFLTAVGDHTFPVNPAYVIVLLPLLTRAYLGKRGQALDSIFTPF